MYDLRKLLHDLDDQGFAVEERRTRAKHQWVIRKNGSRPVFVNQKDLDHRATAASVVRKLVALGFREPGKAKGRHMSGSGQFVCFNCQRRYSLADLSKASMNVLLGKDDISEVDKSRLICNFCQPKGVPKVIPERQTKVEIRDVKPSAVAEDRLLTYPQVATELGVHENTVKGYVKNGVLPKTVMAGVVGVLESAVMAYLERRTTSPEESEEEHQPEASGAVETPIGTRTPAPEASPQPPVKSIVKKKAPKGEPTDLRGFGVAIYEWRRKEGLTQNQLGDVIGTSGQTVANIEMGRKTGPEKLTALATLLGLSEKATKHLLSQKGRVQHPSTKHNGPPRKESVTPEPERHPMPAPTELALNEKTKKALEMVSTLTGQDPSSIVNEVLSNHLKEHLKKVIDEL